VSRELNDGGRCLHELPVAFSGEGNSFFLGLSKGLEGVKSNLDGGFFDGTTPGANYLAINVDGACKHAIGARINALIVVCWGAAERSL
jgi:hypothetical protein